jgi:phosphonopyruvate decarboxylase
MIDPGAFINELIENEIHFCTGVPDSLLSGFIQGFDHDERITHKIAVNEGAALASASGYHLATGKTALVYLQNSGLGNLINPLTSLCDAEVYGIPVVMVIGWRGKPGTKDEPQHVKMGRINKDLLNVLEIPFVVLEKELQDDWKSALRSIIQKAKSGLQPVAILVGAGVFESGKGYGDNQLELSSAQAIALLYENWQPSDIVLCTTGKIGRVFYKINQERKKIGRYFLNVGAMGHVLSLATTLATNRNERVIVLDGDGSLLMHMGALATAAGISNLQYILLNNGAHQSVGGQPTAGFDIDFVTIAKGCGLNAISCSTAEDLKNVGGSRQGFIEIRINTKTDVSLPRPTAAPSEAKRNFMAQMKQSKGDEGAGSI